MDTLFSQAKGCIAILCYSLNTLFWSIPILVGSIVKLIPIVMVRTLTSYVLDFCASSWITVNSVIEDVLHPVRIELSGDTELSNKEWYMVIANHQSWVDILILQRVFNRKIPFLKFFIKQELLYLPVLGLVWWALDFPFMRRYSTSQLKQHPGKHEHTKDIEKTQEACAKFKYKPVSIMNFVEGTRFSPSKHAEQSPPFKHLLKPKAGGLAFAFSAMGEHINKLIDVTICYPNGVPSYWDFITGRLSLVKVHIMVSNVTQNMRGDYLNDKEFKTQFQTQLNQRWLTKDQVIQSLKSHSTNI